MLPLAEEGFPIAEEFYPLTLDGWVMQVGESLEPGVAGIKKELLAGTYLQANETTVPVQMHDRRGSNHQAYLWQYGRPGGPTVFDFALGRDRAGPLRFLGQWNGILQTDCVRSSGLAHFAHLIWPTPEGCF